MGSMGIIPAGSYANRDHLNGKVVFAKELGFEMEMVLFDAQTSGGLLIAAGESDALKMLERCKEEGIPAKAVAHVVAHGGTDIVVG